MHEMVYVNKALDIVLEECSRRKDVAAVTLVRLSVGEATDVIEDFVEDMFRFLARDTVAKDARVVINKIPLKVRCNACGAVFPIKVRREETWKCPECGAYHDYRLVSGREFRVDGIEIERARAEEVA